MNRKNGIILVNPNPRPRGILELNYPPLGLLHIAGACRNADIPCDCIDADANNLSDDEIVKLIRKSGMPVVGVPMVSLNADPLLELIGKIGKIPGVRIIVGGPMATIDTEYVLTSCPCIDCAVIGEAEGIIVTLVSRLAAGQSIEDIPSIAYRSNGQIRRNPSAGPALGKDVPEPAFDLVDFTRYGGCFPVGLWPSASLMVTRGCPFSCKFCCNPIWNHKPNPVSPQTVVRWVEDLSRRGIREVFFIDDTFNCNEKWFGEVCNGLIDSGLSKKMVFKAPFRADLVNEHQLELAREAGFLMLFFGFESGSPEVLKYYNKGEGPKDMILAFELCRRVGIRSLASVIFGCPMDSSTTAAATLDVLRAGDPDYIAIYPLIPYLGTPIADDLIARGWFTAEQIRRYDHRNPTIRTETMTTGEVLDCVAEMRRSVAEFKKSDIRRSRREKELVELGDPAPSLNAALEAEFYDSPILPFVHNDRRIPCLSKTVDLGSHEIQARISGWHEIETSGRKKFRWSKPLVSIPFNLSGDEREISMKFAVFRPDSPTLKLTLKNFQRQEVVFQQSLRASGWKNIKCDIPSSWKGECFLCIEVTPPFVPSEFGGAKDDRQLGLPFQRIEIR